MTHKKKKIKKTKNGKVKTAKAYQKDKSVEIDERDVSFKFRVNMCKMYECEENENPFKKSEIKSMENEEIKFFGIFNIPYLSKFAMTVTQGKVNVMNTNDNNNHKITIVSYQGYMSSIEGRFYFFDLRKFIKGTIDPRIGQTNLFGQIYSCDRFAKIKEDVIGKLYLNNDATEMIKQIAKMKIYGSIPKKYYSFVILFFCFFWLF